MTVNIAFLLAMGLLISIGGLFVLVWALANDQFAMGKSAARTICAEGEVGRVAAPATPKSAREAMQASRHEQLASVDDEDLHARRQLDRSSRAPALTWIRPAMVWLVLGSVFGVLSSLKMHMPELLV